MIFDAGGANQQGNQQVPPGPLYGSEKWRELYKHALKEAKRLGLILGLSIQSGWNLGGPNVTPEFAAKQLTFSQIQVEGPTQYDRQLPLPENHNNYYKDICVLAYLNNENNAIASKTKRTPIKDLKLKVGTSELGLSAPDCRFLLNDHPSLPGAQRKRGGRCGRPAVFQSLSNQVNGCLIFFNKSPYSTVIRTPSIHRFSKGRLAVKGQPSAI